MKKIIVFSVVTFMFLTLSFAITGQQVLDNVKSAHSNFKTEESLITMKLVDSNSNVSVRKFKMYLLKKGDKTLALVRFVSPSEVKRITLLTLSDNEIYIYMPAYRRTKRISGGAKSGKFVGSDFTYSDISLLYNEKTGDYTSELIKQDSSTYVVQILPKDSSDYKKIIIYVDKNTLLFKHIEFYSSKDSLAKIMDFSNVKTIEGHTLATKITLKDVKSDHTTVLLINNVKFSVPITVKFFDRRNIAKPVLRYR